MKNFFPDQVKQKVNEWVNGKIEYFWEADGTYFVVVRSGIDLYFLRLFKLDNDYVLSEDNHTIINLTK